MAQKSHGEKNDVNENKTTESSVRQKYQKSSNEDYGFYFFPERNTDDPAKVQKTYWEKFWNRGQRQTLKCETNVVWCANKNPMVKLMMRALKSRGCEVNLRRHISCEKCLQRVNGGFDPTTSQIVVCQNTATKRSILCSVLAHELIHAFDLCRAKLDFENLEHLACTEIRASNFTHCSYLAAVSAGDASPFHIKQRHVECVKNKALLSVLMVRNISREEGMEIVNRVFDKCYRDLEPFGRYPRRGSKDPEKALIDGVYYGYTD
ncbi:mitochondrial inner membrane protease ATP23 homolog [Gigantopelta aegis]|uniref:mitochondrial inner membrane protease ATP23 homolog n=1 Tax=Gigantopelta aegis TaxID=1735272 RepID=UPI001B88C76A|nr:mitochondrial inner membrane protease ATP23 homolog [Gigantopelta aegis]